MSLTVPVLSGVVLGAFSRYSSAFPGALRWLGNFGALWLAVAFFVGRAQRSTRGAALAGAVTLSVAGVFHYVPFKIGRDGWGWEAVGHPLPMWIIVGSITGALFGFLGRLQSQRDPRRSPWATGSLAGAFAAESAILFLVAHQNAVLVAAPVEAVLAVATPIALTEGWFERVRTYAAVCLLVPWMVIALVVMMMAIGRVYPGF